MHGQRRSLQDLEFRERVDFHLEVAIAMVVSSAKRPIETASDLLKGLRDFTVSSKPAYGLTVLGLRPALQSLLRSTALQSEMRYRSNTADFLSLFSDFRSCNSIRSHKKL